MATHSSVLAWRIPGMAEPGGLPSMGSHRVRHDWSDLAAAAGLGSGALKNWNVEIILKKLLFLYIFLGLLELVAAPILRFIFEILEIYKLIIYMMGRIFFLEDLDIVTYKISAGISSGAHKTYEATTILYGCCRCEELSHWKRPWSWERLRAGGEGGDRGWDGWMASPTQWTWVWARSRRWWRTGRPGVLQSMGSQRVGHNWATEQQQ